MPTSTDGPARSRERHHLTNPDAPNAAVDAGPVPSVSSAGTDGPATASSHSRPAPSIAVGHGEHELVAVGPGTAGPLLRFGPRGPWPMNPLPVRPAKIHQPLLRHDTLSRERLNGWLERAARSRLALVIAEAGFGKTTFLADWSSLTHRRTSWYRLETDDRDWLTLIRHLVAGGREVDDGFAPETYRLLSSLGPGGPTQADLIASLAKEMAAFGAADPRGFSVILDDYHAIEGSEETDPILRALLEATGPGFSIILAARTAPVLPVERLRGRNAVQRLDGDQLRFDVPETERLFRDAYGIPMEPDVVTELVARTEGWAALLSLVRTNLEERSDPDPRALVAQLSATRGDLYDFLAEEVLVDLPASLHDFLIRVSILAEVDSRVARLVDSRELAEIQVSIAQAEAFGLLLRTDRASWPRFHPLVRDFLVAKLEETVGPVEMGSMHRRVAEALEPTNWLAAALHYRSAKAPGDAARVVDEAIPAIIGAGEFESTIPLLDGTAGPADRVGALVLRSRIEFVRGNWSRAITLAEAAADIPDDPLAATAMLNLSSLEGVAGFPDQAIERATSALQGRLADSERRVAEASLLLRGAQREANLADVADALRQLAMEQEFSGLSRYAAISRLNLASVLTWLGDPLAAIREAVRAETAFGEATASVERVAAMTARATALVQLRQTDEAALVLRHALAASSPLGRHEAELEVAGLEANYGSLSRAHGAVDRVDPESLPSAYRGLWLLDLGLVALRDGEIQSATTWALQSKTEVLRDVAGALRTQLLLARTTLARRDPRAEKEISELTRIATAQGSRPGMFAAAVLRALAGSGPIGKEIASLGPGDRHVLSLLAEDVCRRLPGLSATALGVVLDEARARPDRWRSALRLASRSTGPARLPAAQLLCEIGDAEDAAFLRDLARTTRALRDPAALITRRHAQRASLRDLGVVRLEIGGRPAERTSRRKVMALLCFLASRSGQAATRDEALEALWPDVSPDTGANSLHQAIYYLRRIFDSDYREGLSAGYVTFDGEVITLDQNLTESSSRLAWRLLNSSNPGDLGAAEQIWNLYEGRFALDFSYEEWATGYRDTLHAAVLGRTEAAMAAGLVAGEIERVIRLGTSALTVDPSADSIELGLLRAYKAAGRHAAAGEQYAHYSATLRSELGIEPPPYDLI